MATWQIEYTITDSKNEKSLLTVHVPSNAISAEMPYLIAIDGSDVIDEFATELGIYIDGIIDGKISNIRIGKNLPLPAGIKVTAAPHSDVEQGLKVKWRCANGETYRQRIATFREDLLYEEGSLDVFQSEEPHVLNWYEMMTNPIDMPADWGVAPCDSRGSDIVDLIFAFERFKKSRK